MGATGSTCRMLKTLSHLCHVHDANDKEPGFLGEKNILGGNLIPYIGLHYIPLQTHLFICLSDMRHMYIRKLVA